MMKRILVCAFVVSACSSSSSPDASTSDGGATSDAASSLDAASSGDASTPVGDAASEGGAVCSVARAQLLGAVNTVASGDVTVLATNSGVTTLYVDASAGGIASSGSSSWLFVDLGSGAKVPVTDTTSTTSTAWDLAFKRPSIYTNDGDGGPGNGGAVLVAKSFEAVTAADAASATFGTETFFDAQCNPSLDPAGAVMTTFSSWYDYDPSTHVLSPAAGTWLVHGATGKLYKVQIQTYYAAPDGGVGAGDGGAYVIKVGAL